ncbi:hypothetical protein PR048_007587 [Dryococelus australis]|uniref:Transposase n=1 Tax=Dryococelus australis TaxID=614101 RepID=A0ABQ9HVL1_9NEOP|nr:hypothetical protein PR048_007587 [Dryococelus australis]
MNEVAMHVRIANLRNDIVNSVDHVFGDHQRCASYFCAGAKEGEANIIHLLNEHGLYQQTKSLAGNLSRHSRSLLYNVVKNCVNQYNSAALKKRVASINYTKHGSYRALYAAVVLAYN